MWNLEKQYRWTYVQSRDEDTDVENGCMDIDGGVEWIGRMVLMYIHYYV